MAENTIASPAPKKRHGWLRVLAWVVGIFIILLLVAYFVGTSSAFFKGVILPRVSTALNAQVTVSDASISPFSQVVLHNLKVQTTGAEPLVTAPEVRLRYSLMDIIGGNIHIDEVALSSPTIVLIQNPDKTSNLDPILNAQKAKPQEAKPATSKPSQPSKPVQIDLRKLALTDATLRQITLYSGSNSDVAEISHLFVTLDNVKNGQTGKFTVTAAISANNNPPAPAAKGLLQAKLNGTFDFSLTSDLKPASIKGNTHLEVTQADGAFAQAAAFASDLDVDLTPTEIKQVALQLQKGGVSLGQLRVSGPFDMTKTEGRLLVELLSVNKNLLNLAGTQSGLDFGPTTISSTNAIQLANSGSLITVGGQFNINNFQVTRTNQTTPQLDLSAAYDITVDRGQSNLTLRTLALTGSQKNAPFLLGELTSPMQIAWGNTANAIGDSTLNVAVTKFNLADWKAFLGSAAPEGVVSAQMKLLSQQAGKQLTFDLSSQIENLAASVGSNQISQVGVTFQISGKASDMKQFNLTSYKLEVARQSQPLLTVSGSGTYDQASQNADMQLDAQVMLARLLTALPQPGMTISSGTAEFKAHFIQKQKNQDITGSFTLADFTGQCGSNSLHNLGVTADLDLGVTPQQAQIRKLSGKLTQGSATGGSFDLSGTYNLTNQSAQITAKLADFNQNGLGAFLQPMLAEKKLVSVALNANASVQYDPQAGSSVKADLQVTNLVVSDPKSQVPAAPLAAGMNIDASYNKQIADVRQFQFSLTPTSRATNQAQLSGHIDMTQSNAIQGNIKITADSLDVTPYYDLFVGTNAAAGKQPAASKPAVAAKPAATPSNPDQEPAAMHFPLHNFTVDTTVHYFYLREVEITNFQVTTKIDGGHIVVTPCQLSLNGAPVSASVDVDLGVPGFKYDVSFNAQAVPLPPLVDSFQPERKGQLGGTFTAQAKISGAGITGTNLQKNLAGQFGMSSTNLNLAVGNIKNPMLKLLVNVVSTIPELASNPLGTASSLLGGLTGGTGAGAGTNNSLTTTLSKSPIDAIIANGTIGSGKVNLQQTTVRSPAFQADATGTVTLAAILTNSTLQIPVTVSLERSLAQRINMVPANTPTNAIYAQLPAFLTIGGTVGVPKSSIDKVALAKAALQGVTGNVPLKGTAGQAMQGLGSLLGGGSSGSTNSSGTNQTGGLLGGLGGILGGSTGTNAPSATNQPSSTGSVLRGLLGGSTTNAPATNKAPVNNLLNRFLK